MRGGGGGNGSVAFVSFEGVGGGGSVGGCQWKEDTDVRKYKVYFD